MTIEQTLERIATALESLAANDNRRAAPVILPPPAPVELPKAPETAPMPVAATPRPRGRPPGSTAAAKEAAAAPRVSTETSVSTVPAAVAEADPFADAAAAPVVTEGDVRLALQALKDRVGNVTPVFKLLRDIGGVDTLPKLPADKYAAIIAAAKKL